MDIWTIGRTPVADVCSFLAEQAEKGVKYFCFDYFDTLVVRNVLPEYTKQLAARQHSLLLGGNPSAEELFAMRQHIEKKLCEQNLASGGELEFYLPDFAREYHLQLRKRLGNVGWLSDAETFCADILHIETTVEKAVQRPCSESIQVVDYLRKQGLSTVLISDFYLPGSYFAQMLANVSLDDRFDQLFVSADFRQAKGSGRLYKVVCEQLACRPEHLTMVGDNLHSDVKMAREQGVTAIHLRHPEQQKFYQAWQAESRRQPSAVEESFAKALHTRGPFKEISSTLWYFTFRLLEHLQEQQVKDVFFFSKEGEFLKKMFDRLQDDLFGCRPVNSHYLLVSRKATFLASLRPLPEEDFCRLFNHYREISLRDFLLSLNFEDSVARAVCDEAGLAYSTRFTDLQTRPEFRRLLELKLFQSLYASRRLAQRNNFMAYLDSFGVDYQRDGLAIVDVGWKGSIQDNLFFILEEKVPVQGFFVGSVYATEQRDGNRKKGILFDDQPAQTPYFHVYNNNRSLFEMMLGASHGSADGYFTPEQFAALPGDHQRDVQLRISTADDVLVTTLDLPEERSLFEEKIRPIQEQVYRDAGSLNSAYLSSGCTLPDDQWFARRHARMVFTPDKAEVLFFERLYHLENFGVFEYTNFTTDQHPSLWQRFENFIKIRKDPAILEMGIWPPIILRRLGLDFYRHINGYRRFKRAFK